MSVKVEIIKTTSYDNSTIDGKSTMNVLMKSDCRKFAPNIFNKSKCQNCFKTKDSHSAEALECNRATRKIAKCGYLFVAPDWDFSISINRTKRWQRRWFVLYDDGELTYSVDEHPNTIPQALIDMNKVLEVSDAEQLTGNQFSLAITALDRVHFVKGTSRDETKWWCDLLSHYSHGTVRGRLKRNATFPGSVTTNNNTINTAIDIAEKNTNEQLSNNFNNSISNNNNINNKHLSGVELEWRPLATELSNETKGQIYNGNGGNSPSNKLQPVQDNNNKTEEIENLNNLIISSLTSLPPKKMAPDSTLEQENVVPLPKENKIDNVQKTPEKLIIEGDQSKSRNRRYVKRESRGLRSQRSRSDGVAKMIPPSMNVSGSSRSTSRALQSEPNIIDQECISNCHQNPLYLLSTDSPGINRIESLGKDQTDSSTLTGHRRRHASSGQELQKEHRSEPKKLPSARELLLGDHSKKSPVSSPLLVRRHSFNRKIKSRDYEGGDGVLESTPIKRGGSLSRNNSLRKEKDSQVRGDPDGCLPSSSSANPEVQVQTKEGSMEKNGWLFRYGIHKEWFKHWFVLRNSMLSYFRDPSAEISGIMDGVLDLGLVKDVQELASDTNHAFTITTWDNKKHILAASKGSVRSDWVRAIAAAANLRATSVLKNEDRKIVIEDIENLNQKLVSQLTATNLGLKDEKCQDSMTVPDCSSSTSSDDHSEYFSVVDEDDLAERAASPKALPPSPPVNRTAISRVKQKARSRSSSGSRSKRKLRSSSDLGSSSNFDAIDRNSGDELDTTIIVPDDVDVKSHTKDGIAAKVLPQAQLDKDVQEATDTAMGNYRTLLDKYNSLRKQLDSRKEVFSEDLEEKIVSSSSSLTSANDALVENIFTLMKDCKSFLSRLREALRAKNEGEIRLPIVELSLQWKEIKTVCTKLDKILCKLSGSKDVSLFLSGGDNSDLSATIEKARDEIRRLKKDLKASQDSFDDLELHCYKLKQDMNNVDDLHTSHMSLMTARVDDLTSKLTASERSLRLAKQRVAKLEARQERRRSSLKGKEAVSLSKEFEGKLTELEQKIGSIETSLMRSNHSDVCEDTLSQDERGRNDQEMTGSSSIETSATGMLLRLHSLHSKVSAASVTTLELSSATSSPPNELAAEMVSSPPPPINSAHLPLEKPKICLQVKGSLEESGIVSVNGEDAIENWSSLSVTTSMSDLHTIEADEEPPGNLVECLNVLSQKLDILLGWLQSSIRNLTSFADESIPVNNLPDEEITAAKMLEDYLTGHIGGDESAENSISNLCLLHKAITMMKIVVQSEASETNENSLLIKIRLKRLAKAIEQNLKLESDYENSVDLLEDLVLTKGDVSNAENYFEYAENLIENLKNFKHWKIEEVLLPKTFCEVPVKDSDYREDEVGKVSVSIPIDMVRNNAVSVLDGFCFENENFPNDNKVSKEKIMVLIDSELDLLKLDLERKMGGLYSEDLKEDVESVALVGTLERLMSFVLNENERSADQNLAILSLIESLVARWSLQLLAKNLVCVSQSLKKKSKEIAQLKRTIQCLEEEEEQRKQEPCLTCRDLQKQVCRLQTDLRACQRRMGQGGVPCERCRELHRRMEILSERHQMELSSSLEREREEHREELRNRMAEVTLVREMEKNTDREEVANLKQELKGAQNQVQLLKDQFNEQLCSLKEAYEEKFNFNEKSVEFIGEAVLQKYETEMEDLKGLCEKGILVVDKCRRKELMDLTQKQQREIELLKAEKDRALAEESQATATAIEALKRSHREELQSELVKLKEELLSRLDTSKDCNLDQIKQEILQLSEKYSRKCIEHSALEEKLTTLSQQVQQTNHQMLDLMARNHYLQAHLSTELCERREKAQGAKSDGSESLDELRQLLELRETELVAEREEKARVNQQLIQARNELSQQDIRCRQLDQGLRMQRKLWLGQRKLETIAATGNSPLDSDDLRYRFPGNGNFFTNPLEDGIRIKPRRTTSFTSLAPRELLRSPSCPGLANPFSNFS